MDYTIEKLSILSNVISNNKISHAMLFEVNNSDEFMGTCLNICKMILCNSHVDNFSKLNCNRCNICSLIDSRNYPDIKIIESDGNWIKKQQLIDLKNEFNNKSLLDNKKIYIIKDAEKLNVSSSNSLLKFLEEPEDDIIAILLTSNRYLLLDTILSRCQIYSFKDGNYNLDENLISNVETFVDLLVRKRNLFIDYKYLHDTLFVDKNNSIILISAIEKYFVNYLTTGKSDIRNIDRINIDMINKLISIFESEKQKLEFNANFKLWLDSLFSRIIGEIYV